MTVPAVPLLLQNVSTYRKKERGVLGDANTGESLGGILYTVIGAPLMFLIDGISYLFSACTEVFLEIPSIRNINGAPITV